MIYLDYTASTPVDKNVAKIMIDYLTENFGNPSSPHKLGISAAYKLEMARKTLLNSLNISNSHKSIFTSGGSEGNSFVLSGAFEGIKNKALITSDVEHNSIKTIAKKLSLNNVEVLTIKPEKTGNFDIEKILEKVTENTRLVSIMAVNNESGYVFDVENICKEVKRKNKHTLFHTDYVQGYLKISMNLNQCDFITVSAHKIFGPKGTGVVFVKNNINVPGLIGGTHEYGLRGGTQNVSGILGMEQAVKNLVNGIDSNLYNVKEKRNLFISTLSNFTNNFTVIEGKRQSPFILGVVFNNIKSEVLVRMLSDKDVFVSAGSACSSKSKVKSKSINSLGYSGDNYLRISISHKSTNEEIKQGAKAIAETINQFRLMMG